MFKQWLDNSRIFFTRLSIDRPYLTVAPQFRSTIIFLWLIGITGLLYGHVFEIRPAARSLSLLLSTSAWIGSLFILITKNPWTRLYLFLQQIVALVLFSILLFIISVTITFLFSPLTENSVKIAWITGSVLLGYVTIRLVYRTLLSVVVPEETHYPAMRTAPLLFFLMIVNYAWWFGIPFLSFFR